MIQESTPRITASGFEGVHWHTSSYSGSNNNCVEHSQLPTGRHAVRDTKARDQGTLVFEPAAWQHFITAVRNGEFDL